MQQLKVRTRREVLWHLQTAFLVSRFIAWRDFSHYKKTFNFVQYITLHHVLILKKNPP